MPASTPAMRSSAPAIAVRRKALIQLATALTIVVTIATCLDRRGPDSPPAPPLRVDVNSAPAGVLEALPRIGPALAARIIEARGEARFVGIDDLDRRVRGIGPVTIAGLRPYIRFD